METASINPGDLTDLLQAWAGGDSRALERLIPAVYGELRRIAQRCISGEISGQTLQATALAHEAYLRLVGCKHVSWQNRAHFFAVAARQMRHILVDIARSKHQLKRGGSPRRVSLEEAPELSDEKNRELLALEDALKDLEKLELTGQPVSVVGSVMQALNTGHSDYDSAAGQFSTSASGSLIYASGGILPDMRCSLVWVDHEGNAEPISPVAAPFGCPRLSPDGVKISYSIWGLDKQIYVRELGKGIATKITSEGKAHMATWTPDGRKVVFDWWRAGPANIYWQTADGSLPMERLTTSENLQWASSLSPDGNTLAFVGFNPDSGHDLLLLHMHDRKFTPFLNSRFDERWPEFSPDGRFIAYASDESGDYEVYVRPFPGLGGKTQVSNEGGAEPLWSRDGKQLFYRRPQRRPTQVWVVDLQTVAGFSAGKPRLLFERAGYGTSDPTRDWDISLDGQKFLMVRFEERKPQPVTEMVLVQNWLEELKRLVPVK
jgi:RNA polymerase sigma factor (TIGR02999 family)